jgi:hypothetical protein
MIENPERTRKTVILYRNAVVMVSILSLACSGENSPHMQVFASDFGADDIALETGPQTDSPSFADNTEKPDSSPLEVTTDDALSDIPQLQDFTGEWLPEVIIPDTFKPDIQSVFQPGHWECTPWAGNMKCVPIYEQIFCGDGKCHPELGESHQSCPDDCNPLDTGSVKCEQPLDCIFLDWPFPGAGYWGCEWVGWGQGYECTPLNDPSFCNSPKGDWCAEEWGESAASCPEDCAPENLDPCAMPLDCIFQDWPEKIL